MRTFSWGVLATCLLTTLGCGGDGSGGTTLTFGISTDATVQSNNTVVLSGATAIRVGDTAANVGQRGALRFGILFLPANAVITSARLRIQQVSVTGNPFGGLGAVVVDHVDFGASVEGDDFNPAVLTANVGTLSADATLGVKEIDVTAQVAADLAALDITSDFLLRCANAVTDSDATVDVVAFDDSEGDLGSGVPPSLTVTYQ